jgi:hypothetical protein
MLLSIYANLSSSLVLVLVLALLPFALAVHLSTSPTNRLFVWSLRPAHKSARPLRTLLLCLYRHQYNAITKL